MGPEQHPNTVPPNPQPIHGAFAFSASLATPPSKVTIHELTEQYLEAANAIGARAFPDEEEYFARSMRSSLAPKSEWPKDYRSLRFLRSYVMLAYPELIDTTGIESSSSDPAAPRVVGVAGIRAYEDEPNEAWLGWICLHPKFQGKKVGGNSAGKNLLRFVVSTVRKFDFAAQFGCEPIDTLRLCTTNHPAFASARRLYKGSGFQKQVIDPTDHPVSSDGTPFIVYSLGLHGNIPSLWGGVSKHGFLDEKPPAPYRWPDQQIRTGQTDDRPLPWPVLQPI